MTTEKKKSIEKYAECVLQVVEVANEVVTAFEEYPWSAPVQCALLGLKLIILMYLKSAAGDEPQLEPGVDDPAPIAHEVESVQRTVVNIDISADEPEPDAEVDDPAGDDRPGTR